MTNLTSEQYREVLKNVEGYTEEIPTVQQLMRRAVETFFDRFGAYPDLGGVAPGKVGMFGDQIQLSKGSALSAAIPLATVVVGRKATGKRFTVVTSADVGKPHKVNFSFSIHRPLARGSPSWLNHVKGVIENFEGTTPAFDAAIESSIPLGVGLGSSSGVEVAIYSFMEILAGKKTDPKHKAKACQRANAFAGNEVGVVDRMTSVLAKDRHAMVIDCKTNEVEWVPIPKSKIAFVVVDAHVKDSLFGDEYTKEVRYLTKACELLGVEDLRNCTEEHLQDLELRVSEQLEEDAEEYHGENSLFGEDVWTEEEYDTMIKRVKFFIGETSRLSEAVQAWKEGDVESFGEMMVKSHKALIEDFNVNNVLTNFLVETSLRSGKVWGSRMTGMGFAFGGTIISVMKKKNVKKYCKFVSKMFQKFEDQISEQLQDEKIKEKRKRYDIHRAGRSKSVEPSAFFSGSQQNMLGREKVEPVKNLPLEKIPPCTEKRQPRCVVQRGKGKCATWPRFGNDTGMEEFWRDWETGRKKSTKRGRSNEFGSVNSSTWATSKVKLSSPTFYLVSPFAGARMMFVTRADMLRSRYARPLPDPKALVRAGLKEYKNRYGTKLEAIGLAPSTVTLFGEFMEFHAGFIICMALPMYTVTLGGRNNDVHFAVRTTSDEVEKPTEMKCPLPCICSFRLEARNWVNYVKSSVNEFREHVPGFNGVIHSSVPIEIGVNSCAALQASIYTFLEKLTREPQNSLLEKAERCSKSEYEFLPEPSEMTTRCSSIKFLPTFLSEEGHLTFINFKRYKISQCFFDHPSYVFILAFCKRNYSEITIQGLEDRLKECKEAIDALERRSLLGLEINHLRCLSKLVSSPNVIKRAKYVISEHERTVQVVSAIKAEDYERIGVLMNQSQDSLRDDYEVSNIQIDELIKLARGAQGVLGAKMLGKGLNSSIIILVKISYADQCMRHMRNNYSGEKNELFFYLTKPSQGAFAMNPEDLRLIP